MTQRRTTRVPTAVTIDDLPAVFNNFILAAKGNRLHTKIFWYVTVYRPERSSNGQSSKADHSYSSVQVFVKVDCTDVRVTLERS